MSDFNIDIERFNGSTFDRLLPTPSKHASSHASGGSDALTPAAIGAKASANVENIAHGGTGATTAEQARTNLGITPHNIGSPRIGRTDEQEFGNRLNNVLEPGMYYTASGCQDKPQGANDYSQVLVIRGSSDTGMQIYCDYNNSVFVRGITNIESSISFGNWVQIFDASGGSFTGNVTFGGTATMNNQSNFNGEIILNSATYGNTLPTGIREATQGRLFFKKVTS